MDNREASEKSFLTLPDERLSLPPTDTATPVGGHIPPTTTRWWGFSLQIKRVAVLIDGEFFSLALRSNLHLPSRPTADQVYRNAKGLVDS